MLNLSRGSRFRTTSLFVNDRWRLGRRWSFNLGLRWDADDSRDQARARAGESDAWSPRLAAAFDPRGDGAWSLDAGYARYVASLAFGVGDLGTTHGRPARFAFNYLGPPVNDGSSGLVTTEEALAILFAWFDANGGTSRPLRGVPTFPGLNRRMDPDLVLPKVDETTLGVTRRLGGRGLLRVAALRRDYVDQHSIRVDLGTGQVADPGSGRRFDLRLIGNSDRVERTYEALLAQLDFRPRAALRLAGSYTLSATRGNLDLGDSSTIDDDLRSFPEYGEERWRAPTGPLAGDQPHRLRLWASWDATLPAGRGRLSIAALERVESGQAWSAVGEIDSRPYVANPGYVGPPARVPYYFERRGRRRTETATATDLAVHATFSAPALRRVEPFARLVVVNLFDESAQTGPGRTTVLTAANDPRYRPFDPFRETPVRGVHWDYAPGFGRALDASDYQQPRTVEVAVGLRF